MKRALTVLLLTSLLLFGCTQPNTPAANASNSPTVTTTATAGPNSLDSLAGLGFVALSQTGQAVSCDVSVKDKQTNETQNLRVKLRGKDVRIEADSKPTTPGEPVTHVVFILTNKTVRFGGTQEGQPTPKPEECTWIMFNTSEMSQTNASSDSSAQDPSEALVEELKNAPEANFRCQLATLDAHAFNPEGKTCSLEDMFNQAAAQDASSTQQVKPWPGNAKNAAGLIALNAPVECTLKWVTPEQDASGKQVDGRQSIWIDGQNAKLITRYDASGKIDPTQTKFLEGSSIYQQYGIEDGQYTADCHWNKYNGHADKTLADNFALPNLTPAQFDCTAGTFTAADVQPPNEGDACLPRAS